MKQGLTADELIERMERETGQRIDDENSFAMIGLIGAMARMLGESNHQERDDIAAGVILNHRMTPEYRRQQRANEIMAEMLTSGMSPDDLKDLL